MKLHRNVLFAGVLAFGVAACGDDVTVVDPPPPPVPALVVSLTPSNATVNAGEVADFAVGVSGGEPGAAASWTCASSNTSVATVAQTATGCRATGVASGNASVTATVTKGGDSASAGAQIAVRQIVPATVSIANVTNLAGTPQNLTNVVGQINVTANVAANDQTLTRLELVVSDADGSNPQVVASQEFSAGAFAQDEDDAAGSIQQIQLSFNTADFTIDADAGVGVPRHLNGPRRLSARIFVAGGAAGSPAAQNTVNVTLNNADTFIMQVANSGNTAMDNTGQIWVNGDITVTAMPLMFSGRTVSSATLDVAADAAGFATIAAAGGNALVTSGPPFTATWTNTATGARRVNNIEPGAALGVVRASVLSDGSAGPNTLPAAPGNSAAGNFFRLDNMAPSMTDMDRAVRASRWVNASWSLTGAGGAAVNNITVTDNGVGGITLTRAAGTTTANVETVANAGDLAESATDNTYVLRITATDALGNSNTRWFDGTAAGAANNAAGQTAANATGRFGVDNTPPTIAFTGSSAANAATTGALTYNFLVSDPVNSAGGAAGFDATSTQGSSIRTAPAATACAFGAGGNCTFSPLPTTPMIIGVGGDAVNYPNATTVGYFNNTFRVVDRAGNASETLNRMGLSDNVAPVLGTVAVSGSLAGGQPATFAVAATDNLNLGSARVFQTWGAITVEMQAPITLGTFGTPLNETEATVTATAPFIRGLQNTDGANNPAGAFSDANNVRFDVRDLAANQTSANGPIAFARPVGAKATFDATWAFAHTRAPAAGNICIPTATACPGGNLTQVAFTPTVAGPIANDLTNVPFTSVVIVWRRVGGTDWFRLNTTSAASATDVGANRTWTFGSVAFAPTAGFDGLGAGANQDYEFVAIGVDAQGDALMSQVVNVNVFRP